MVSIGLAIPRTRFPSVELTWEFTPLSHEPGAICTWEAGESGTHMLGHHACSGLHAGPQSPFWGETLASSTRAVYPPRFVERAPLRWGSVFL
jgi:hypothetical protein